MGTRDHRQPAPPMSVIERCAGTDPITGAAHGVDAHGSRGVEDATAESLRWLAMDMAAKRRESTR